MGELWTLSNGVVPLLQAEIDIQAAFEYFEDLDVPRGTKFLKAVQAGFANLSAFPEIGPAFKHPIRRLTLSQFRHGIFSRIHGKRIVVLAVLNLRMDPQEILRRLSRPG